MADPKTYTEEEYNAMIAERDALKNNRDEILKESKRAKDALKAYDGVDPAKYAQLVAAAEEAEQKRAEAQGDIKSITAQFEKKMADLEAKWAQRNTALVSEIERDKIDAAAAMELAKHSDNPKLLMPHIKSRMKVIEEDGKFHARVIDENGTPRIGKGSGSSAMTLSELVEEMKQDKEFAPAFRGSGSSGGGASRSNAGGGGSQTISGEGQDFLKHVGDIAVGKSTVHVL